MNEVTISKAPWRVEEDEDEFLEYGILDADGNLIVEVIDVYGRQEEGSPEYSDITRADAYLMAAAPTLAQGIKDAIQLIREGVGDDVVVKFLKDTLQAAQPVTSLHGPRSTHASEAGRTDGEQRGPDGQGEDPGSSRSG